MASLSLCEPGSSVETAYALLSVGNLGQIQDASEGLPSLFRRTVGCKEPLVQDLVSDDIQRSRLSAMLDVARHSKIHFHMNLDYTNPDDKKVALNVQTAPVLDESDCITHILLTVERSDSPNRLDLVHDCDLQSNLAFCALSVCDAARSAPAALAQSPMRQVRLCKLKGQLAKVAVAPKEMETERGRPAAIALNRPRRERSPSPGPRCRPEPEHAHAQTCP
jgi:hypothetical protein